MQWASMQSDLKQAFVELALGVFHEVEVQVLPARDISSLLKVAGTPGRTIGSLCNALQNYTPAQKIRSL